MRLLLLALAFSLPAVDARTQRSAAEVLAFKRQNPCPSTQERRGACPGWEVDMSKVCAQAGKILGRICSG